MRKKIVAIWLCFIMVLGTVVIFDISVDFIPSVKGTTLYVNTTGSGGAYIKIQWAIDNASTGDIVYVYNGTYYENVIINKTINLFGEDRNNTIIDGGGNGDVIHVNVDLVNISRFHILNSGSESSPDFDAGIDFNCNNGLIRDIYFSDNRNGIYNRGIGNIIYNNTFSNNSNGIWTRYSNSLISNNIFFNNLWYGIVINNAINITLVNNSFINEGIDISGMGSSYWDSHNIDTTNKVNGKSLYYWNNINGGKIPLDAGQIILASCTNVTVGNQIIKNTSGGIHIGYSEKNFILNNTLSSNKISGIDLYYSNENIIDNNTCLNNTWGGISLGFSSYNNITNNTCQSNVYGILLQKSSSNTIKINDIVSNGNGITLWFSSSNNNLIFHNNIINNFGQNGDDSSSTNYWNNGYPIGGNYWSEYSGNDDYKGYNQDQPGSDSIGDTPYQIDSDSRDNYPLMEPYTYNPLENYTILKQGWNLISLPLIQEELNLTRVLGSINSWYDAVQWYDSIDTNDNWKHNKVGKPFGNDLYELNESIGFWIHVTQPGDTIFVYNGTQPIVNQTISLIPGWNLVGYPSKSNKNRTDALNNIDFGSGVDAIWTYNATSQKWKEITASDNFEVGRGYWVHSKVTKTWIVPL